MYRKLLFLLAAFNSMLCVGSVNLRMEELQCMKRSAMCCIYICSMIENPAVQCAQACDKKVNRNNENQLLQVNNYNYVSYDILCCFKQDSD